MVEITPNLVNHSYCTILDFWKITINIVYINFITILLIQIPTFLKAKVLFFWCHVGILSIWYHFSLYICNYFLFLIRLGHPQRCYTRGNSGPLVCLGRIAAGESRGGPVEGSASLAFFCLLPGWNATLHPYFMVKRCVLIKAERKKNCK